MFQIITDIADLQPEWLNKHPEVSLASSIVVLSNGKEFYDGITPPDQFIEIDKEVREQNLRITTSMPAIYGEGADPPTVEELTRCALEKDLDVLYLAVNSTISGTYGAVSQLFEELSEEYPERKLICLDSECASTGLAMLIRDLTATSITDIEEAAAYVKMQRKNIAHVFSWSDLDYITKSGKVPAVKRLISKVLHIVPIGSCEYDEENVRHLTVVCSRLRGEKRLAVAVAKFIKATITSKIGEITVSHGNAPSFVIKVVEAIREELPEARILFGTDWRVGLTIQAHGGPTSLHINYHRKPETNSLASTKEILDSII